MFNKLGASEADLLQLGNDRTKYEAGSMRTDKKNQLFICFCIHVAAENEATMLQIILSMEIELHEATYDDELRARFNRQIIPL